MYSRIGTMVMQPFEEKDSTHRKGGSFYNCGQAANVNSYYLKSIRYWVVTIVSLATIYMGEQLIHLNLP